MKGAVMGLLDIDAKRKAEGIVKATAPKQIKTGFIRL